MNAMPKKPAQADADTLSKPRAPVSRKRLILRPEPQSRLRARRERQLADRRSERAFIGSLKGITR